MKSLWDDGVAARYRGDLAQRVYSSRLLGADTTLVLHGGGNTSVKGSTKNIFGDDENVVFVKGSGWDLETIEAGGFAPCRIEHLLRMATLDSLTDAQMAVELRKSLTDIAAPNPSVEAILHAILPAKFVDHTHADAFLTIANTPDGERRIKEIYGDRVVFVPYVMPGFKLAKLCAELYPARVRENTIGMALMNHGLFSFGESAKESYERMIELVSAAEDYLAKHKAWNLPAATPQSANLDRVTIAALRKEVSRAANAPMIMSVQADADALGFARRSDVREIANGPATPDHVIRTKRTPMIGRDVDAFAAGYRQYFAECGNATLTMLDPAPRVILDPELGMCAVGRTAADAGIVADIFRHTMHVILRASALDKYRALPAQDVFDVEYWDLEQMKLRKPGSPPEFGGEVAVVTGAASGIGKACVKSLLKRGAAVVGLDIAPEVRTLHDRNDYAGIECDLTDAAKIAAALDNAMRAFGGIDILILNAGVFPRSSAISALSDEAWKGAIEINLNANLALMRECHPILKLAPRGGRVVVIGSKNVAAPGPGAASYSASKAALLQLARVAALEWGEDHIRVNTLHPNQVFDTGIWNAEILSARAAHYGQTVEEYKTDNVLKVEITSNDVAELAAELCGPLFAKTTGAQIPVDGGNVRVI